jgi:hypothetical protein
MIAKSQPKFSLGQIIATLVLQRQVSLGECGGTGETVAGPNGSTRDSHEETQAWTPAKFVV